MKKILFCFILLLSGCSTIDLYSTKHFVDLSKISKDDLVKKSQENFKASGLDEYLPTEDKKEEYYNSLASSMAYRNYLFIECLLLLQKEQNLDLDHDVYASHPKWNNLNNWYSTIVNFRQASKGSTLSPETTMECDLTVNKKKEVSEYQLIKYAAKFIKN